MTIDQARINRFLSSVRSDDSGSYTYGPFDLLRTGYVGAPGGEARDDPEAQRRIDQIKRAANYGLADANNVKTICLKLAWMKDAVMEGKLSRGIWTAFATSDIDMWHVEMRSLFDHLATLIRKAAPAPARVEATDFLSLQQFGEVPGNHAKLGNGIPALLAAVDWIATIKEVRDASVHQGGWILVFPEPGRILFQSYRGHHGVVNSLKIAPEMMFNQNVVDFEAYAGVYTAYTLDWMDQLATQVMANHSLVAGLDLQCRHSGLDVVSAWAQRASNPDRLVSR